MSTEQLYQRCVGGHFHPVELVPAKYHALPEIDEGNFPARNLLPETIDECPMLNQSTTGHLTNISILAYRIKQLEKERDQLLATMASSNLKSCQSNDHLDCEPQAHTSQRTTIAPPPGLSKSESSGSVPEIEGIERSPSPTTSTSSDHMIPMLPKLIWAPKAKDFQRMNLDDRTYATLRHSEPSQYRVRNLVKIPFLSRQGKWLTMAVDVNVPFSIAHTDLPKYVQYVQLAKIKPCCEHVNWFLDRKLTSSSAITQAELPIEFHKTRDILRFTFKLAERWTEPNVHVILGSDFFIGNTIQMYESYVSIKKGTYKPIVANYELLRVVNTGREYPHEKEFLVPEPEESQPWTVQQYPRPPTPPLKTSH